MLVTPIFNITMNKKLFFCATFLSMLFSVTAGELKVTRYLHAGPVNVVRPVLADTVNVNGQKFKTDDLLKTGISFQTVTGSSDVIEADTAGYAVSPAGGNETCLHLFGFYLHSDRYVKGTLEVSGPGMFEVYVNGKKEATKTTLERACDKAGSASVSLTMEPYRYEVVVKYLAVPDSLNEAAVKASFRAEKEAHITAVTSPEKNYSLTHMLDGTNFRGIALSPDGKYAIVNYAETFPGGKTAAYTEVIETATGNVCMRQTGNAAQAKWMPASNRMYYTRQGMKGKELVTLDPVTRQETVLSEALPDGYFNFSPDETFLLYSVLQKGPEEKKDLIRVIEPDDRQPGWRNRYFIYKYDLSNGLFEQLTFGYATTHLNDVSADSRYILFGTSQRKLTSRPFSRGSLYRMDLQTMRVDTVWEAEKFLYGASFSPDGKQLLIQAPGEAFGGIGLNIAEGQQSNSYDNQLFIMNLADKKVTPLTKDFDPNVLDATWNKYDNRIYFTAEDRDYQSVFRCNPASGEITPLKMREEVISGTSLAEKAPLLLYYGQSVSNANRLYAYDLKNGKSRCLADLSAERLENVRLGEVHDWNFTSTDGTTVTGRYYLPPHFDPAKKYPMIVYYYGGTSPTSRLLEHRYSMHLYAALGYVVYTLNPSGTTGFGQEFAARHVNAWGKVTADEIIQGTELFCEEHPFVNKQKIGCMGASYGGFMTQYLQTRTNLFAAAISHAGISSIASYWGEGYWGYSYSQAASADSYPWNNPELYTKQSPLFNADKINTPLLLLHGNADTNVPIGESIQLFTALKLLGKTVEFVQVDGENHGIVGYEKRIGWNNTIFAWFAKWLKDEPEWWSALYPERNL